MSAAGKAHLPSLLFQCLYKMKRYILTVAILLLFLTNCLGQVTAGLLTEQKKLLAQASSDTARIRLLLLIGAGYRFSKIDSALFYIDKAILLARKSDATVAEARALSDKGSVILDSGDVPRAYAYMFQSLNVIRKAPEHDKATLFAYGGVENRLGNLFMELGEYNTSIEHYRISISYYDKSLRAPIYNGISNIGNDFELMGRLDSAQIYQRKAYDYIKQHSTSIFAVFAELQGRLGNVERDLGHYTNALNWYRSGAHNALQQRDLRNLSELYLREGETYSKLRQPDSGFLYARKTLDVSRQISMKSSEYQAAALLSALFKATGKPDSALFYLLLSQKIKDELFGPAIFRQLQQLALTEQQRQQQLQEQNDELKYRYAIIAGVSGFIVILLVAFIMWMNYRKQKSTNKLLSEQKEEIAAQRDHVGATLDKLKATQHQLIQSEKMASLGELTAGIAHEIQNPLNFVNNFSEVSVELLDELKEEAKAGHNEDVIAIAGDLSQNLEKISHHGKRADAIVKGMLQHSQTGSGTKELTNINALVDECMRLAYHGLRAKDKAFNAEMAKHLDETLPKINVIPQDIVRVMLNLFNNAFYAVNQKQKMAGDDYKPEVSVSTSSENDHVIIKIKDNGTGIPDAIKDKIMQPFFTTKPTGEGTGLGLSLTYDMVVKGQGGNISVDTEEGIYTEFTVSLPL
jgi:two-component system NtrC family sensor kinase